jgi:polysaccharide biosynthesis protein PslH
MAIKKLKILMILIEPPLPFGNAGSRWFHVLLKGLDQRGHAVDVMVVSGVDSDIEKAKKKFTDRENFFIFPFGKNRGLSGKLKTLLFPHRYIFNQDFRKKLRDLKPEHYDIIHIEQTWAGWIGFKFRNKTLMNVHFLQSIDLGVAESKTWKFWLLTKSWFLAEKYILMKYPYIRTCSPRLTEVVREWDAKRPMVATVPFSLDLNLYPWIPRERRQFHRPTITLIGGMTWYPSVSAAVRVLTELWPEIKRQTPDALLRIVGWSAKEALKDYLHFADVEILENVPDIQPYFEEASVMLYAPVRGSGMKIKILESLAFGIPVITTSEGAEGLPAVDMVHMGLCEDNAGLIERTVRVLKDPELQETLRQQGRQLLASHCGEDKTVGEIEVLYQKIITNQTSII